MAGTYSRVAAALFFDAILHLILKLDDWACNGPEKFTVIGYYLYLDITTDIWVIVECLKEFCLKGHVNLRGYND